MAAGREKAGDFSPGSLLNRFYLISLSKTRHTLLLVGGEFQSSMWPEVEENWILVNSSIVSHRSYQRKSSIVTEEIKM